MKKSSLYIILASVILLLGAGATLHLYIKKKVAEFSNISIEFEDINSVLDRDDGDAIANNKQVSEEWYKSVKAYIPFTEINAFDEESMDWTTFFDGYASTGVLVFDANNDGLNDVYLCHNNNTWARPTNDKAVLQSNPVVNGNGLYLNRGNDHNGNPIYKQVKDLSDQNDSYIKEELLIENLFYPRQEPNEKTGKGRISSTAIAADLNNDGRLDLVVGSLLPGMLWSDPKTQRVLGQFVRPVGREAVNSKIPLSAMGIHFLKDYKAINDMDRVRTTSRGDEPIGANSVFLNMGDKDNDGLPEWKDISRESGLEGKRCTQSLLAMDVDLDGDLDIFESNIMDEDYWPGGATALAGACNQLYINQLAETGKLSFTEKAAEMNVDGMYDEDNEIPDYYKLHNFKWLPKPYSVALHSFQSYKPDFLEINGSKSESAEISWASVVQDVNEDGYPDIWVANDLGFLRLYLNEKGKNFIQAKHARSQQSGYWMSLSPADFNGDLKEDLFAGNMGGASMNLSIPAPDPYSLFEPVITTATLTQQIFGNHHNSMHALIDGSDYTHEMKNRVKHSEILPPDASLHNNVRDFIAGGVGTDYDPTSLDPYEFTWGSTILDVQNDGKQDLYWVGCLYGRGGGIFPIMGTGPGRLLVNTTTQKDQLQFADLTAEHHLFNIQELQYDKLTTKGYIYRNSPKQNWGKRSTVYSYDLSSWGFQGPEIIERITNRDMIQASENGRAAIASDLNGDGYSDIIVRNKGGYDSRSSNAQNLKAIINGHPEVIPAHDPNFPSPTNFEAGSTRLFMNNYSDNNWIKVKLIDDSPDTFNRDAIGAKIILNDRYIANIRSGSGGFISNSFVETLFGLGHDSAKKIEVHWPDKERSSDEFQLTDLKNGTLTITRSKSKVMWKAKSDL